MPDNKKVTIEEIRKFYTQTEYWEEFETLLNEIDKLSKGSRLEKPVMLKIAEDSGTDGWVKLNLVVNPKNGEYYLSGDRKPGTGDMPFEALDYIEIKKVATT